MNRWTILGLAVMTACSSGGGGQDLSDDISVPVIDGADSGSGDVQLPPLEPDAGSDGEASGAGDEAGSPGRLDIRPLDIELAVDAYVSVTGDDGSTFPTMALDAGRHFVPVPATLGSTVTYSVTVVTESGAETLLRETEHPRAGDQQLTVMVVDRSGSPIEGAQVQLSGGADMITDDDGVAVFPNLPAGLIGASVTAADHLGIRTAVMSISGRVAVVQLDPLPSEEARELEPGASTVFGRTTIGLARDGSPTMAWVVEAPARGAGSDPGGLLLLDIVPERPVHVPVTVRYELPREFVDIFDSGSRNEVTVAQHDPPTGRVRLVPAVVDASTGILEFELPDLLGDRIFLWGGFVYEEVTPDDAVRRSDYKVTRHHDIISCPAEVRVLAARVDTGIVRKASTPWPLSSAGDAFTKIAQWIPEPGEPGERWYDNTFGPGGLPQADGRPEAVISSVIPPDHEGGLWEFRYERTTKFRVWKQPPNDVTQPTVIAEYERTLPFVYGSAQPDPAAGHRAVPVECEEDEESDLPAPPDDPRSVLTAGVDGDPHLRGFDLTYDLHLAGEFVLLRDPSDGLEIQARFRPVDAERNVTVTTALAARVNGSAVMVSIDGRVLIDDQELEGDLAELPFGGSVRRTLDSGVVVDWPDGSRLQVEGVAIRVSLPARRGGSLVGLLGNADGDPENDFVTREGVTLEDPSMADVHRVFGESWRLDPDESFFSYAEGESVDTFTEYDVPSQMLDEVLADLPPDDLAEAESVCREAGVVERSLLDGCVVDVAVTGDLTYADRAAGTQASIDRHLRGDVAVAPGVSRRAGFPVRLWAEETVFGAMEVDGLLMEPERDVDFGHRYGAIALTFDGHTAIRWAASTASGYLATDGRLTIDGFEILAGFDRLTDGTVHSGVSTQPMDGNACGGGTVHLVDLGDRVQFAFTLDGSMMGFVVDGEGGGAIRLDEDSRRVGAGVMYVTDGIEVHSLCGVLGGINSGGLRAPYFEGCASARGWFADRDGTSVCLDTVEERLETIQQWEIDAAHDPFGPWPPEHAWQPT